VQLFCPQGRIHPNNSRSGKLGVISKYTYPRSPSDRFAIALHSPELTLNTPQFANAHGGEGRWRPCSPNSRIQIGLRRLRLRRLKFVR
jgi:hypothetical protein